MDESYVTINRGYPLLFIVTYDSSLFIVKVRTLMPDSVAKWPDSVAK